MSIRVTLEELPSEISKRGGGFLLSSAEESRPHASQHRFEVVGTDEQVELRATVGRTALANCRSRPSVTVLWPAPTEGEHSLIVDGQATVGDEDVVITVLTAVLHRPA